MALYTPLIDKSYFTGELTIGQVEKAEVQAELLPYCRKYEYDFMLALMGEALYNAFYTGINGVADALIVQKWSRMAFGYSFVLDSSLVKTGSQGNSFGRYVRIPRFQYYDKMNVNYRGLLKRSSATATTNKLNDAYGGSSPIAKYIYYWWNRAHVTASGGATESAQLVHNGQAVINNQKMVRAWNEMCAEVFEFYLFLDMNITDYPEFDLDVNARYNPAPINDFNFL